MPALAPIPGVARVVVSGTYSIRTWANIFHVALLSGDPMSQAVVDDIAATVYDAYGTNLMSRLPAAAVATQCLATDLGSDQGLAGVASGNKVGTETGNPVSLNSGLLVNWRIAKRYRGGHPRTYLPGAVEDDVDGPGVIIAAAVTEVTTGANAFIAALVGNTGAAGVLQLVTPHYVVNNTPIQPPVVPETSPILSGTCNKTIASQRRRVR